MRHEVKVTFDCSDIPGGVEAMLAEAGCRMDEAIIVDYPILKQRDVTVTLLDTDERLPKLRELLERYGEPFTDFEVDKYTEEELDTARLLLLRPIGGREVDGGVKFGTTYDVSGSCPTCGAGARQTSALFLDGDWDELPKLDGRRAGGTYLWNTLLDDRLAAELDTLGLTGLVLHNVYALMLDKRQVKLRWRQISADRTLPRMAPQTTGFGLDRLCKLCERSGYAPGGAARIVYRASDLEGAGDVNLTWETHGWGDLQSDLRSSNIPVPFLLVTPRVRRFFVAAGVTEFLWTPIRVVDE